MSIRVIQQTTEERNNEIRSIFEECRPYLDEGMSLQLAVKKATNRNVTNVKNGWFRALIEYAESQGFDYHAKKWQRGTK